MSKFLPVLFALGLVGGLSACAQPEEEVIMVAPEPISSEPVYTGKYK
ncbi:hypothetical protein [Pseudooceanicola algae]|uniref:Lipoprotein n=1 Tax=Pseudooceanicola algae TaxID=1537215 RepID=A0A418SJJ1_9RHOB|nr:hypothetical protein [Pseudooceanicola algae]QPM91905.1 hypothetical protein PSAL_031670 [Pseudooceanicola algae]